jgi:hypothetical protein
MATLSYPKHQQSGGLFPEYKKMIRKWNLKSIGFAVIAAAFFSTASAGGLPRGSPEKVTDEDIVIYQDGMERGCTDAGRRVRRPNFLASRFLCARA